MVPVKVEGVPFVFSQRLSERYDEKEIKEIWQASKEYREFVDHYLLTCMFSAINDHRYNDVRIYREVRTRLTGNDVSLQLKQLGAEDEKDSE